MYRPMSPTREGPKGHAMPFNRQVRIGSTAVLAALSLAACGGAPDDAGAEEFCATWTDGRGGTVDEVHASAERLEEVGTPEDVDDAARAGFEVFVDALSEVDRDDLESLEQAAADESSLAEIYGITEDEAADIMAFFEYANGTCSEADSQSTGDAEG